MILTAFFLAISLRFDGVLPSAIRSSLPALILPLIVIKLASFSLLHLFSGWWRYVSLPDLIALLKANFAGSALYALYVGYGPLPATIPWSVLVLDGLLCFLLMSGMRVSVRLGRELVCTYSKNCNEAMKRIVIVGSGAVAQTIVREIRQSPKLNWDVVELVDQDTVACGTGFKAFRFCPTSRDWANCCAGRRSTRSFWRTRCWNSRTTAPDCRDLQKTRCDLEISPKCQ